MLKHVKFLINDEVNYSRKILFAPVLLVTFMTLGFHVDAQRHSVLIITGQNNHHWPSSASIVEQAFNESPLFAATVIVTASKGEDMSDFKPEFKKYDVVCLDYNGDPWPVETQKKFEKYVRKGGAVVLYHASDNSFPDWKAYNQMIGLGGWNGRTEKDGPYIYWKDGAAFRDYSPGVGGAHGRQGEYLVVTRNAEHPIMIGLPVEWLHVQDELYSRLRGPGENMEILATAAQDTTMGGTGRQEPVLFTIMYGKGRIFHSVLGHAGATQYDAVRCVGFIETLLRGAEWAVTGMVTQEVPADFPTATKTSIP